MKRLLFNLAFATANPAAFAHRWNHIGPLPPVRFRDEVSLENYLSALRGDPLPGLPELENPLLIIIGPQASGKSRLARHFAEHIGCEPMVCHAHRETLLERELGHALKNQISVVLIDNVYQEHLLRHPVFKIFSQGGAMSSGRFNVGFAQFSKVTPPRVIITSDGLHAWPGDLLVRSRVVHLDPYETPSIAAA
jgi:hypothetical protein